MKKTLKIALLVSLSAAAATVLAEQVSAQLAAKLSLEQQDKRLYSHITVTQPQHTAGKITVVWTAPEHSYCSNSAYPLDYKYNRFRTRAYRTVVHVDANNQTHVCAGTWRVQVLDDHKNVLAHSEYLVKPAAATSSTK